jgi:hypothetical protein
MVKVKDALAIGRTAAQITMLGWQSPCQRDQVCHTLRFLLMTNLVLVDRVPLTLPSKDGFTILHVVSVSDGSDEIGMLCSVLSVVLGDVIPVSVLPLFLDYARSCHDRTSYHYP